MNQQTNFERMAMEHAAREAELDRLQLEREINGPTQLEIARARIAELEIQRDQVYADAAEWIKDLQEYLPGATGLHDVYRIAKGRAAFRASRLSAGLGAETENGMKAGEMKRRRDEVITRMLEIEAELKEMKRIWLTEGLEGATGVRATLEAESAALNCEKNKLNLAIHAGKKAEQAYKQATFTAVLVRMLQERDMSELVRDAERISMDMMISAYRVIEELDSKAANCKAAMQKLIAAWPDDMACETEASAAFDACYEVLEQEKKS